jgi:hypothetical protein
MSLTKLQKDIVDALHNGGFIWRAGTTHYLARVQGSMHNGQCRYQSEIINVRTFRAMDDYLEQYDSEKGGKRWRLK